MSILIRRRCPELFTLDAHEFLLAIQLHLDILLMLTIELSLLLLVTQLTHEVLIMTHLLVLYLTRPNRLLLAALTQDQRTLHSLAHFPTRLQAYMHLQSELLHKTRLTHPYQRTRPIGQQQIYQAMKKEDRRTLSLEALARHQERIHGMVKKIEQYKPTFHLNRNYQGCDITQIAEKRQKKSDQLFEENMKLIYRIQTTGPKIETKRFPQIKTNPRRLKSLSITRSRQSSNTKVKIKDVFRNGDEVFEENVRLITNIECTRPKIQCWTTPKMRNLNELMRVRKREEEKKILEKFKDISKELGKLGRPKKPQRSASIFSLKPPILPK